MGRRTASLALLVVLAAPAAPAHEGEPGFDEGGTPRTGPVVTGPAKPAPAPGTSRPVAVPKALPSDRDDLARAATESAPPFFGVFGPAELLEFTGFASKPGDWIEFEVVSRSDPKQVVSRLRVSHVAPAVERGAWIEIDGGAADTGEATTRMLTHGRGNGNVSRVIARMGGMPPIELPLASLSMQPDEALSLKAGPATITRIGPVTTTVPLGTFKCEQWRVLIGGRTHDFYVAEDKSLPFNRVVRMDVVEGIALAVKRGTNAVAKFGAPKLPQE